MKPPKTRTGKDPTPEQTENWKMYNSLFYVFTKLIYYIIVGVMLLVIGLLMLVGIPAAAGLVVLGIAKFLGF